jgi:hypothetical protein
MNPIFQNYNIHHSLLNHNDILNSVRIINSIHELYMNPWNIQGYERTRAIIDDLTENHDVQDWTEDEWNGFMNYAENHVPEYNEFLLKCYAIYIDDDWLLRQLMQENEDMNLLYFAAGPVNLETYGGVCFEILLNHILDRNILQPLNIYEMFVGCTIVENHASIDIILENQRIRNIIQYDNIPQFVFQRIIEVGGETFLPILDIFEEHNSTIPNHYDIIPTILMNMQNNHSIIRIIRHLIQNGIFYHRNQCLNIVQMQNNNQLYQSLINIL